LKVIPANPRGYCHGVVTAMRMAREVAAQATGPVYMLGYLVHNEHLTGELEELGIKLIDAADRLAGLEEVREGTVIFTAHGIAPAVREQAEAKGLNCVDTTCSDVESTHALIIEKVAVGFQIVYVGRRGHPEALGCVGEAPDAVHLVQDVEDVKALELDSPRIAVTTQTTLSVWDTAAVIEAIRERYPEAEIHNEICLATQDRQEAVIAAAQEADLVLVVGSLRSSNSQRLVEVTEQRTGKPAYLVDSTADINPEWLRGCAAVAVSSGASTPSPLTRDVISHLEALPATV
ncbi:MAG TPA: 4-hydroxy-3-methylbut-2-enyl diphosphate reductase, partial [Chloroflexota bacterium]|nr:4-hydroxy-3-methylbut-2-enyl diphosphate reductase [Chloroflexota bacterium]